MLSSTWEQLILVILLGIKILEGVYMATKGARDDNKRGAKTPNPPEAEDILSSEFVGEFGGIPASLEAAIGAICRLAVVNGGYFGVSVTDDRVSCRFVLRTERFVADKRLYRLADFEKALAVSLSKLRG